MPYPKRDVRLMIAKLKATRGRVRELTLDGELASSHEVEQMQHVRMLEKQAAWKSEAGFDRIDIIAEMHEQTLRPRHAGFDSKPLHTVLYNPRWPPTSEELTAGMNVEVGSLRLEILLAQLPPPPQYDISPRRSCDRYGVVRTWSAAYCDPTNGARGNFSFKVSVDGLSVLTVQGSRSRWETHHLKQTSG